MPRKDINKLVSQAQKPGEEALKLHPFYRGKMQTLPRCRIRDMRDMAIWYSPGVAEPCKAIQSQKEKVYEMTSKWNTVAVVSDGTRVLGLGDIGPEAALPVMEGKALLFKYLGGVDAVPICLKTKNPDEIIQAVKWLQPGFAGINLEDISSPKCFYILDRLRQEAEIPVWHDDQQGTATVTLAALINALKLVGKKKERVKLAVIGSGAANVAILRLLFADGFKPQNTIVVDSKGILNHQRSDLEARKVENYHKWYLCQITNAEGRSGNLAKALRGVDVCISLSKPGPGVILPEWVSQMRKDAIVFACANPVPEIWPWEARQAGARVVATGRSDFPNQVNNSMGFPAIFRGTLDVRARMITDEMCLAAAYELAKCAEEKGLSEEYITPSMDEWEVLVREAVAVGLQAQQQGVAALAVSRRELRRSAENMIKTARQAVKVLMQQGIIPAAPEE